MAKNGKCSLVLGINRDLFEDDSLSESFYREVKNGGEFNLIFETNRNNFYTENKVQDNQYRIVRMCLKLQQFQCQ